MREAQTLARLLRRFGQVVSLRSGGAVYEVHAVLQPIPEGRRTQEQRLATPLGVRGEDRYLYFGPADISLVAGGDRGVRWHGQNYVIQMAHPIYMGEKVLYWQAVLAPED